MSKEELTKSLIAYCENFKPDASTFDFDEKESEVLFILKILTLLAFLCSPAALLPNLGEEFENFGVVSPFNL